MSRAEDEHDHGEVSRLLAGAAKTIASVRHCWLTTASKAGGSNVTRPDGAPAARAWRRRLDHPVG